MALPLRPNPWSESENKSEKVREQGGGGTEKMRWDYRDNASRWREVEAPSGLSTPNGLKDFNRATDNSTDAAVLALQTPWLSRARPPTRR